jgi:methionyl-tRNA synthetase
VLDATLGNAADVLRVVAALIEPVMPATSARIRGMLGIGAENWVGLKAGTMTAGREPGANRAAFPES